MKKQKVKKIKKAVGKTTKKTTKKTVEKSIKKTAPLSTAKSKAKKKTPKNEMVPADTESMDSMAFQDQMESDIPDTIDEMNDISSETENEPEPEMDFQIEDHPLDLHDDEMDEEEHF